MAKKGFLTTREAQQSPLVAKVNQMAQAARLREQAAHETPDLFGDTIATPPSTEAHADPEAEEPRVVCRDVLAEAQRLGVATPRLSAAAPAFLPGHNR